MLAALAVALPAALEAAEDKELSSGKNSKKKEKKELKELQESSMIKEDYQQMLDESYLKLLNHRQYLNHTEQDFLNMMNENGVLVDLKGIFRGKINKIEYWSL